MTIPRADRLARAVVVLSILALVPLIANAQVIPPSRGGTGTSTVPSYGLVLVGNANGTYTLTATSSLGITGTGGSASWGAITGTLSNQTDLAAALAAKLSLLDWYSTSTSDIAEGSNLYYTDARVNSYVSGSSTIPKTYLSNTFGGTQTFNNTISGSVTGNAGTATALAANGADCSAGSFPLGVDASGAVVSCTDAWTEAENTAAAYTPQSRQLTLTGTANEISISAGAQTLAADRTWVIEIPAHLIQSSLLVSTGSTTNATSTNQAITNLFTFNGVTGSAWSDFCTAITGGSGLCDGADATGTGGSAAVATSTSETRGNLAVWTSTAGTPATLGDVATSSLTLTYPIKTSATLGALVGGSNATLSLDFGTTTPNTWAGTQTFTNNPVLGTLTGLVGSNAGTLYQVASSSIWGYTPASNAVAVNTTYPLQGGGDLTSSRTLTLAFGTTTPNAWSAHNNFTGGLQATNSTSTNATTTGTLAIPVGASVVTPVAGNVAIDTTSGQFRYSDVTGTTRVYPGYFTMAMGESTTTAATTTRYLGPAPANITVQSGRCETNTGTVNVSLYDGTNRANMLQASTTIGNFTYTSNNTFTAGESMRVDFGTRAASARDVSCRWKVTYDSD